MIHSISSPEKNKPAVAITGYHLAGPASGGPHLEWDAATIFGDLSVVEEAEKENPLTKEYSFANALCSYWRYKWLEGCEEHDRTRRLEGKRIYTADNSLDEPVYVGDCTITEQSGSLMATGVRTKTYTNTGAVPSYVNWSTNIIHKCFRNDEFRLITSHDCHPPSGSPATTVFMLLKINVEKPEESLRAGENSGWVNGAPEKLTLEGAYYFTGSPEAIDFPSYTGSIVFERRPKLPPDGSREKSGRVGLKTKG